MSTRTVALALDVTSDARNAADDVDALTAAYRDLDSAADRAAKVSESVADRHAAAAEATDNLASKSSMATGALGALGSGFELVGLEGYADRLGQASLATDFLSGVGDSLTLVLESQTIQTARAKAQMIAHKAATVASSAATKAATAAQWAMNAAMSANPLALIVIAVMAVVAVLVILYRRSETVRAIIDAVGRAGATALGWVVDKAKVLATWVGSKLGGAFNVLRRVGQLVFAGLRLYVTTYITVIRTVINLISSGLVGAWNTAKRIVSGVTTSIKGFVGNVIDKVADLKDWVGSKLGAGFEAAKTTVNGVKDALLDPFETLYDIIKKIVDWLGKIKFPSPPSWLTSLPLLRTIGPGPEVPPGPGYGDGPAILSGRAGGGGGSYYVFNISGALDPDATARQIAGLLRRHGVIQPGQVIGL